MKLRILARAVPSRRAGRPDEVMKCSVCSAVCSIIRCRRISRMLSVALRAGVTALGWAVAEPLQAPPTLQWTDASAATLCMFSSQGKTEMQRVDGVFGRAARST